MAQNDDEQEINTLFVWYMDGSMESYIFPAEPVISFSKDYMKVVMGQDTVRVMRDQVYRFTHGYTEIAHLGKISANSAVQVFVKDNVLSANHLKAGAEARICDVAGLDLLMGKVNNGGEIRFDMSDLPSGVYILSIDKFSYKFKK